MRNERKPPTRPRAAAAVAAVLAAGLGAAGCGPEAPVPEPVLRPVRTVEVAASGEGRVRTFAGVARASLESSLSFRVAGTVTAVATAVGRAVGRGQVLARLDPADYELRVEQAEAALAQARAGQRKAGADYDRVRALYENNNAAKGDLDAARAAAESARAQVEAVEKELELARKQLGYTVLRAPVAGSIAAVDVEVNENVGAGKRIFLLTAGARPEVEAALPEAVISQVRDGQPATVAFGALPGRRFAAAVTEVGVAATGTATTFPVTVRLERPDADVRSGMAAEVEFRFPGPGGGGRVLVPPVAVGEDADGRFVFVVEPAGEGVGVVRRRPVEVGELTGEGLEIRSGLAPGERIATAGARRLEDGARVKLTAGAGA